MEVLSVLSELLSECEVNGIGCDLEFMKMVRDDADRLMIGYVL